MADATNEYRVFFLSSGQMAPEGSTGRTISGGIMWIGEEGTFPTTATLGKHLDTDPEFSTTYNHRAATEEEIEEYNNPPAQEEE